MNKLLLIDGMNILRRCYEANPTADSVEKAESAASVAAHSMRRALREHVPTHAMVIFDHGGPTWRHALYPEYKANRTPMSPYLCDAVLMKELLSKQAGPYGSPR
jgi:DNA polymerase-1